MNYTKKMLAEMLVGRMESHHFRVDFMANVLMRKEWPSKVEKKYKRPKVNAKEKMESFDLQIFALG